MKRISQAGRSWLPVGRGDRWLARRSAELPTDPFDGLIRGASLAANHSAVWVAAATVLGARPGPGRRAALRGVGTVAASSVLANGVAKNLFPRRRPPVHSVTPRRRLATPPMSSSFPSGHAASAAAFCTAVALESPAAAMAVGPVAALVGYSRVHTGVHWPSDVVAGAALGVVVAVATRNWWPPQITEPTVAAPAATAPALPDGDGLLVLVNRASGPQESDLPAMVREVLPAAQLVDLGGRDITEVLRAAIAQARPKAIGVIGGDGTVRAVAQVCAAESLPLLVLPGGTLNHFARDLGLSRADVAATRRLLDGVRAGRACRVDLAEVSRDGAAADVFVNTASIGGYPDMVVLRERWTRRLGKTTAAVYAMVRVLRRAEMVALRGENGSVGDAAGDSVGDTAGDTWMFFVGNGRYAPVDGPPLVRPGLGAGMLDVRNLAADTRASRWRLIGSALTGRLRDNGSYRREQVATVELRVAGAPVTMAVDGEVLGKATSFRFAAVPGALTVYC